MRKWISELDSGQRKTFVIEEEDGIGFYLYVFEEGECTNDYLQDSFDIAVEQAEIDFGVNRQTWKLVRSS